MTDEESDPQRWVKRYGNILARVRHMMRQSMFLEEQIEADLAEAVRETKEDEEL